MIQPERRGNNEKANKDNKEKHNADVQAQLDEMKKEIKEFKEIITTKVKELATKAVAAATA
eukprot:3823836-Ditylum_brightwellii.AAC.1